MSYLARIIVLDGIAASHALTAQNGSSFLQSQVNCRRNHQCRRLEGLAYPRKLLR